MRAEGGHVVVVLAAGRSRRLGQPKQLLRRHGETLLARCLRLAADTRPQRLRVVVNERSAGWVEMPGRTAIEICRVDGEQLADSLRAGLDGLDEGGPLATRALLLPCDLPRLDATHLSALLQRAAAAPSGIAVVRHGERPGIPVVLPAPFGRWREALSGDRGLQVELARWRADTLGWLDAPELGQDIDTPAQLAAARAAGWLDPPLSAADTAPYS